MRETAHRPRFDTRIRRGAVATGRQIADSVTANSNVAASTVTATITTITPTVAGNVSISANAVTATVTTIAPTTVSGGATVVATVVTATTSVPAPTVTVGDANISASVVTATVSVPTATAISGTTPIMLGALAWWDGNDPEADGSSPSNGANPTAWNDRTSNAHHLDTRSGTPTFNTSQFGSQGAMDFDGVDDGYRNASPFMFANGTIEIWAVVKSDESGTGSVINECHSTQNGQAYRITDDDTNNDYGWNFDNASNTTRFNNTQDRSTNAWDLVICTDLGASGGTINEVVDVDSGTTGSYTRDSTTFNRLAVGYLPRATPAQFLDGKIALIVVFSSQRNSTQRQQMADWVNWLGGTNFTPA